MKKLIIGLLLVFSSMSHADPKIGFMASGGIYQNENNAGASTQIFQFDMTAESGHAYFDLGTFYGGNGLVGSYVSPDFKLGTFYIGPVLGGTVTQVDAPTATDPWSHELDANALLGGQVGLSMPLSGNLDLRINGLFATHLTSQTVGIDFTF